MFCKNAKQFKDLLQFVATVDCEPIISYLFLNMISPSVKLIENYKDLQYFVIIYLYKNIEGVIMNFFSFYFFLLLSINLFANDNKTPLEFIYENKLGPNITIYHRYAQFFLDSKVSGNKESLQKILNSQDDYLKYYEAILKGLYNYYLGDKSQSMYQLTRAYDRENEQLKNSFEGIFVENIFLKEKQYDKLNLILTDSLCETLSKELDRNACFAHMTLKYFFLNDFDNFYINLSIIISKNKELGDFLVKYIENNTEINNDLSKNIASEISNKEDLSNESDNEKE